MDRQPCVTNTTLIDHKAVTWIRCLSPREAVGLLIGTESAYLSLVAVTIVLVLICRNVWRKTLFPKTLVSRQRLIQVPADVFMLSLFIADLIQALGGAMNVKWVHAESVYQGNFCKAQGAIEQLGETTVAINTLVIAAHTFSIVWWGKGIKSCITAAIVIGIAWLFVILYVALGMGLNIHSSKPYMTPTVFWCWIGPNYMAEKITGEYMWFWLTLALSLVFYVPLFFWARGNITVDEHKWWKFTIHWSKDNDPDRRRHSIKLIAYPVVYSILIIPSSVVRFIEFGQEGRGHPDNVPSVWTFFSESTYRLGGILNVLLFVLTRRGLLLFGNDGTSRHAPQPSNDSREKADDGRLPSLEETPWEATPHQGDHRE